MSELDKIKECLDFFCRRCNEQGFYSPPLQPIVKEAYEAIAALRSEPVEWQVAMRNLVFAARTTGGTAGPDEHLKLCCEDCEEVLAAAPSRETAIEEHNHHISCEGEMKSQLVSEQEIDYAAVNSFAAAMKEKLDKKRDEGSAGWHDPEQCSVDYLRTLLDDEIDKGDMVDIGNFAMMIWNRTRPISARETDQRESSGVKGWEFSAGPGSNPAPMHGQSKTGLTGSHPDAPTYQRESAEADNSGGQSLKSGGSGSSGARPPTIANHPDRVATTQTDSRPTAEPALSAEQIAQWRQRMNDLQAIGVAMPPGSNVLADMALSSLTARDEWKNAVIDELVVCHAYHADHDNNPRKALKDAIHWNIQVALDPAVSEDAQKLRDEGIEAVLNDEALHLSDRQRSRVRNLKGQP